MTKRNKRNKEKETSNTITRKHVTSLVVGDSILRHMDETHMSHKFNVKVRPFLGAKISDMHHYLICALNKKPDYIVLHVGTDDAVDTETVVIVDQLLQLKYFVKEKLRNCKIVLSRRTQRADNKVVTQVVDDVITQLKELQKDMISNEDITRKDLGKNSP